MCTPCTRTPAAECPAQPWVNRPTSSGVASLTSTHYWTGPPYRRRQWAEVLDWREKENSCWAKEYHVKNSYHTGAKSRAEILPVSAHWRSDASHIIPNRHDEGKENGLLPCIFMMVQLINKISILSPLYIIPTYTFNLSEASLVFQLPYRQQYLYLTLTYSVHTEPDTSPNTQF
jgi:hypothetical protein